MKTTLLIAVLLAAGCTAPSSHSKLEGLDLDAGTIESWESGKDVALVIERDPKDKNIQRIELRSETNAGAFKAYQEQQKTLRDSIELSKDALKLVN